MWPESLRRLLDAHEGYRSRRGVTHAQLAAGARAEGCRHDPLEARVGAERVETDPLKVVPQVRAPRAHAFQHLDRAVEVLERVRPRGPHLWHDLQWIGLDPLRTNPRFQRIMATSLRPSTRSELGVSHASP